MSNGIANRINPNEISQVPQTDRDLKIIELYSTGSYSYTTLSRIFKITSQRVGQIIKKHKKGKNES